LRENLTDLRRNVQLLTARNEEAERQVSVMTVAERQRDSQLFHAQGKVQRLEDRIREATRTHSSEINRLQAERDATPTDLGSAVASHQEEIKRLNEAHEAQISELASAHDATVQELRSEVEKLNDTLHNAGSSDQAEERHSREIKDAVDRERANASKDLQDTTAQHQKRISDLENQLEEERKQRERSATLSAPPSEAESAELIHLKKEIQRLESLLASKNSEETAAEEQKKLSDETQEGQTKALADCNDRVKALENTNTELKQHNETLLEKEREVRDAGEKARSAADQARTENEALHEQIESLNASLSARDGNEAAIHAAQRARDNEVELNRNIQQLQQQLNRATESTQTLTERVGDLQGELTTTQGQRDYYKHEAEKRDNDEHLNKHIQQLQQDLAKVTKSAELDKEQVEILENDLTMTEEERDYWKKKAVALQDEGDDLLDRFNNLSREHGRLLDAYAQGETNFNTIQVANDHLNEIGKRLENEHLLLQQTLHEQHRKCQEEKDGLKRQNQALLDHEKGNKNTLREQVSGLQRENAGLRSENDMLRNTNTSLIQTNNGLADQDLEDELTKALQAQAQKEQVDNANQAAQSDAFTNQPLQSNPFSNPPPLFPSQAGTASGGASPTTRNPKRGPEAPDTPDKRPNTKSSNALGRKIAPLRSRTNSPVKTNGESEDPAQDILDWCN